MKELHQGVCARSSTKESVRGAAPRSLCEEQHQGVCAGAVKAGALMRSVCLEAYSQRSLLSNIRGHEHDSHVSTACCTVSPFFFSVLQMTTIESKQWKLLYMQARCVAVLALGLSNDLIMELLRKGEESLSVYWI
jgi:hypothetical protein